MLAMGQALLCFPKLLLIDELSQGLAPLIIKHLLESPIQLKKDFGPLLIKDTLRKAYPDCLGRTRSEDGGGNIESIGMFQLWM